MTSCVAVLGTGIMGAGMARNLVRAGLDVTVWNRSADKARPLADDGAAGDDPSLMQAVHHLMSVAADAGHADEDMAAVVHAFR